MPHTNQTKMILAQSLQDLMTTVPLEKISVNDIVEHAGVGRNTFYYHFEDKYDLVNWYFQTGIMHFLVTRETYGNWHSLLNSFEAYLRENKTFYTNALQYSGQNSLRDYMYGFLYELFRQRLKEADTGLNENELDFSANFFTGGILSVLLTWVNRGMKDDFCNHYEVMHSLCSGDLVQLLLQTDSAFPVYSNDRQEKEKEFS